MGLKIVKRNAVFRNEYMAATIVNKFVCSALGFCAICLRQKYCSRLGNTSPTACITCSARCIRESLASRLLRTKHANANEFALLSASAYICMI